MIAVTLDQVVKGWVTMQQAKIKPVIVKSDKGGWNLSIFEDFSSVDDAGNPFHSSDLDDQVRWVTEKLEGQKNCSRRAWNIWQFKYKRDAEKFLTVYYLIWGR